MCFFFKQKTAYEMRISDWSSDVCSSDLAGEFGGIGADRGLGRVVPGKPTRRPATRMIEPRYFAGQDFDHAFDAGARCAKQRVTQIGVDRSGIGAVERKTESAGQAQVGQGAVRCRSEERRVGKECVSKCSSRLSPDH